METLKVHMFFIYLKHLRLNDCTAMFGGDRKKKNAWSKKQSVTKCAEDISGNRQKKKKKLYRLGNRGSLNIFVDKLSLV